MLPSRLSLTQSTLAFIQHRFVCMRQGHAQGERGSVTAEFALALPAIALVLAVTIGSFSLQIERINLVSIAASISRAAARGEDPTELMRHYESQEITSQLAIEGEFVCATSNKGVSILALPESIFELSETQCARRNGL